MLKRLGGGLLALIAAFAIAQGAEAKPRSIVFPGGEESRFELRASNGYTLEVSSEGREVVVTAMNFGIGKGSVSYQLNGRKHGERGFEAKLPGVGRIAVEFRPRGKPKVSPLFDKTCTGKPGREEAGTFIGTINFHGERGYSEVTATRARGTVIRSYRETCPVGKGSGGGGKGTEGPYLSAAALRQGLVFSAVRVDLGPALGGEISGFSAAQFTSSHGMEITRFLTATGKPELFSAEHTGRTASARVEPPAPFRGTADFGIAADGSVSWTGDLSLAFPGTGPIRFAGKRFLARLCVDEKCAGDSAN